MQKSYQLLLGALILSLLPLSVFSQKSTKSVLLPDQVIQPKAVLEIPQESKWDGYTYVWAQFHDVPDEQNRAQLSAIGCQLEDYIPHLTWRMRIPQNTDLLALSRMGIRAIFLPPSTSKFTPELTQKLATTSSQTLEIAVHTWEGVDRGKIMQEWEKLGIWGNENDLGEWQFVMDVATIRALAQLPFVKAVGMTLGEIELEKTYRNTVSRANYLNSGINGLQFNGAGITIAVKEGKYDTDGIDWQGRSINAHSSTTISGHATGVATNMGGAGNYDPKFLSTAWGATIMAIQGSYATHYNNSNLRMINHSYGWGVGGGYNSTTRAHDNNVRTMPGMIHVYSAGNVGGATSNYGPYNGISGWANLTGAPKQAKNIVATGNTNRYDELIYGSVGPTYDGRLKPDICIEGQEGTSYSAPKMCGVMAQLFQAYKTFNGGTQPESGLIKAMLMNTADDIGNPGPDFRAGYGRLNVRRAYDMMAAGQYLSGTVTHGGSQTHTLSVPAGTAEIRVMLYWTDYEASINAAKALVNDLDLTVTTPTSQTYQPWVLNIYPDPDSLNALPVRKTDTLNNVEQVTLAAPASGNYTVTINGTEVPQGPQGYFLVYEFVQNTLLLTSPIGREHFVPGETEIIKWDALGNVSGPFDLDYSSDDGVTWNAIATAVTTTNYDWVVPNITSGRVRVRVKTSTLNSVSPETFHISEVPTNLEVFRSCGDSITLIWDAMAGATGYRITMLGQKYMDSIGYSTNPWFVAKNIDTTQTNWFSVQAYSPDQALSRRHLAVPWAPGDTNCSPAYDAEVIAISPFSNGYFPDCITGSKQPVTITIRNSGVSAIANIPVRYQVDNGPIYSGLISSAPLLSPGTGSFTFPDSVLLGGSGTYQLKAWCEVPGDAQASNDTVKATIIAYTGQSASIPYTQNFDNFTNCSTTWGCEGVTCSLTAGWYNQPNTPNIYPDSIDFRTHNGSTGTGGTGPSGDHTTGSGKYLYLETSGNSGSGCQGKQANLLSPCFDLTGANAPTLSWWYHMYGGSIGELHLDILGKNGWTLDAVPPVMGAQGNNWVQATADLSDWIGQNIVVRFRATTGSGYTGDLAIDDINLESLPNAAFTAPSATCPGSTVTLQGNPTYHSSTLWDIQPGSGWAYAGGSNASTVSPQVTFNDPGAYTLRFIAFGSNGNDTTYQILTVGSIQPDLGPDLIICPGDSISLMTIGTYSSYSWSTGGNSPTVQVQSPGVYWLEVMDSSGCAGRDSIVLNNYPVVTPVITQVTDTLFASGTGIFQWYKDGVLIAGATQNRLELTGAGLYHVVLTSPDGCETQSAFENIVLGLAGVADPLQLDLFPVPAREQVSIRLQNGLSGTYAITLRDIQGREIRSFSWEPVAQSDKVSVSLEGISMGIFLVEVTLPDGSRRILRASRQ